MKIPIAKFDVELESFLDSVNLVSIDYERDTYRTIYITDTLSKIGNISFASVFDSNDLSQQFNSVFHLQPVQVDDSHIPLRNLRIHEIINLDDGTTLPFQPSFEQTIDFGVFSLFNDPYTDVHLNSGSLKISISNHFPIDAKFKYVFYGENSNPLFDLESPMIKPTTIYDGSIDLKGKVLDKICRIELTVTSSGSHDPFTIDYQNQFIATNIELRELSISQLTVTEPTSFSYAYQNVASLNGFTLGEISQMKLAEMDLGLEFTNALGFAGSLQIFSDQISTNDGVHFFDEYSFTNKKNKQVFSSHFIEPLLEFGDTATNEMGGNNEITINYELHINLHKGDVLHTDAEIQIDGYLDNFSFIYAFGDFQFTEQSFSDSVAIDLTMDPSFYEKLKFQNPKIHFITQNSFGFPLSILVDAKAKRNRDGAQIDLILDEAFKQQMIHASNAIQETKVTEWSYDRTNSNIPEFISHFPDTLFFDAKIGSASTPTGIENFIHKDSKFELGVIIEIPLDINVDNLNVQDSIHVEVNGGNTTIDKLIEASLTIHYTSYIPLDIDTKFTFTNPETNAKTTLDSFMISSAQTDQNGEVLTPSQGTIALQAPEFDLQTIVNATRIDYELIVNSYSSESKDVSLSADATIYFDFEVELQFALDD